MNKLKGAFEYFSNNLSAFLSILSVFSVVPFLVGIFYYDIAIFQPLEELAIEQSKYRHEAEQKLFKEYIIKKQLNLAHTFMNNERYEAAKYEYLEVLKIDKYNIEARKGLLKISTYERFKKNTFTPDVVESQIKMLVDGDQEDPHVNVFLGNLYDQLDMADASIENYSKAILLNNDVASAWFGLGLIYEKKRELLKATDSYEKAVALSKWNNNYLTNLAYIYSKTGQYKKAIENYETILKLDYSDLIAYLEISIVFRLDGQFEMALDYIDYLLGLFSDKKIIALNKNKSTWVYDILNDDIIEEIHLTSIESKKYYVFWTKAINQFLHKPDDLQYVSYYIQMAESLINRVLKRQEADTIKKLVKYDISQLLKNKALSKDHSLIQRFKKHFINN